MNALRKKTLANYRESCALCDVNDKGLLVSSHIARWADQPEARGLLSNTICLCVSDPRTAVCSAYHFNG